MPNNYILLIFPRFGSNRQYEVTEDEINRVISYHEVMGDYVLVKAWDGREVYRSYGLKAYLNTHSEDN